MIYIDFDGVILDTEDLLFEDWRRNIKFHSKTENEKVLYIQKADWNEILNNSPILNDSLYYLNNMDPNETCILTKIHSLSNEGKEKIRWIREKGIEQNVILVPYHNKKTDLVRATGNILIDDCLKNLDDWLLDGGKPILFDSNDDDYDSWNQYNDRGYEKVLSLSKFINKK